MPVLGHSAAAEVATVASVLAGGRGEAAAPGTAGSMPAGPGLFWASGDDSASESAGATSVP